ncbi:MAG: DNA polymerase/3'-5' exonuclease PolX [Syntrophothermus sp.]
MENIEVAWVFRELADLVEISGDNPFKARAYRAAAHAIEALPAPLAQLEAEGKLREIPGVGEAIAKKINEILATGTSALLERLRAQIPPGVIEMTAIPGVGPKLAHTFYHELGISTIPQLYEAAKARRLRELRGVGVKLEQKILRGIEFLESRGIAHREGGPLPLPGFGDPSPAIPLGVALPIAEEIRAELARVSVVARVEIAGSLRRRREMIGDVDLLAASEAPERVMELFLKMPQVWKVLAQGPTRASVLTRAGIQLDLRVVAPHEFAAAWQYFTGSAQHNVKLRHLARQRGYKLNEYGLFRADSDSDGARGNPAGNAPGDRGRDEINSEADLYRRLGLAYIEPELREGRGEIEAAAQGALPELVELGDLRGDLHVHSTASDGIATLEQLLSAAEARGYEYLGICDHSRSLAIAHGLTAERLGQQGEVIKEFNARAGVRLLRGIEVDILSDGRLDFPDEILAELDLVVASVHSGFKQDGQTMNRRIEAALKNPHVDILGHPSGRMLGRRPPYQVDLDFVIETAARTGTVLEINASPERLDLNDIMTQKAVEHGVMVAINSDAHSLEQFNNYPSYGVAVARRGWATAENVLNTLTYRELLKRLSRRR